MLPGLGHDHQLFNGKPTVATLTEVTTYAVFDGSNNAFFIAGGLGAAGDLVIATGFYDNPTAGAAVPGGFTQLALLDDTTFSQVIWAAYRILDSGDVGLHTYFQQGGGSSYATMQWVLRPNIAISELIIPAWTVSGTTDGVPSNINISAMGNPAAAACMYLSSGALSAPAMSVSSGGFAPTGITNILMRITQTTSGGVTCSTNDDGTSNGMIGGVIGVR